VVTLTLSNGARSEQKARLAAGDAQRVVLELPVSPPPAERAAVFTSPTEEGFPWIYLAGAVGGAGLATGTVTGLLALNQKSIVKDNCQGTDCNATGKTAADTGKTEALASTVGFGVGIAGLAAMIVIHFTDAGGSTRSGEVGTRPGVTSVAVGPTGVSVGGAF
jgi:hypothetical protein